MTIMHHADTHGKYQIGQREQEPVMLDAIIWFQEDATPIPPHL